MSKDAPKSPDPNQLIQQQLALNRVNQQTPFGSMTFNRINKGKEGPNYALDVELSKAQQKILDQQESNQIRLGNRAANAIGYIPTRPMQPFDPNAGRIGNFATNVDPAAAFRSTAGRPGEFRSNVGRPGEFKAGIGRTTAFTPGDFEDTRGRVEHAQFERAMSLMNPQFALEEERMQQRLANQGLPQSSEAYTAETGRFSDAKNRAMQEAALSAVLAGGAEQSRLFGQGLDTYQQNLARQQQQFGQDIGGYQQNLARQAQLYGQDLGGYQTNLGRQAQLFGQDLGGYQANLARQAQNFGQDLSGYQANLAGQAQRYGQGLNTYQTNQAQRGQQMNELLAMMGLTQVQQPGFANVPQVDIPYGQGGGGGGANPFMGTGIGALSGAAAGAPFGPWGAGIGAGLGGLFGLGASF